MPETDINQWGPGASVQRVEINCAGSGWNPMPDTNDRCDPASHLPLHNIPAEALIPPEVQPEPPPPTETELRARLASAIAARDVAEGAMRQASEAHRNAMEHESRAAKRLAAFVTLGKEIDEFTVEALRTSGKGELSDELRERVQERIVAEAEHAAAKNATATLLHELSENARTHDRSLLALRVALHDVLGVARDLLRAEMFPLQQRVVAYEQTINFVDESAAWIPVAERLLADPLNADLHVEVGDAPEVIPPAPVIPAQPSVVRIAKPVGSDEAEEIVPAEEYYRRLRAARKFINDSVEEFEAIEKARKLARWLGA